MIGKAISAYKKFQMDIVSNMSIGSEEIIDEAPFFDEGYISSKIERLKLQHQEKANELKIAVSLNIDSDYEKSKKKQLQDEINILETKIIHLSINSLNSLDMCKQLMIGKSLKVEGLIRALDYYDKHDLESAKKEFGEYFVGNNISSGYYLGNKIYGKILMREKEYQEALKHLEYAIQYRVDDNELLILLKKCYENLHLEYEADIVDEVLQILG